MDSEQLKKRTFEFALRVIKLTRALPATPDARAIGNQLVRSGTAVGANYRATCKGRSRAEFIAKIGVAEEEADESGYWMELIVAAELLPVARVQALLTESLELSKIFGQSRLTALRNTKRSPAGNRQ